MSQYLQGRGIHVDRHLTQIAINYRQEGFIADLIFPVVQVMHQSNMIKTYNQGDLWRVEDDKRSPGTEANRFGFQVSSDTYLCKNYAIKEAVTIEDRANADPTFIRDLEQGRVERIIDKLHLSWEDRVAAAVVNSSNVSTYSLVGSAWTDLTNSDPLGDVRSQIDQIHDNTGFRPTDIVMSDQAFRYFRRNDNVIDKVFQTGVTGGGYDATVEQCARLLDVKRIHVGAAHKNTADEGQSATLSRIWNDHVAVYFRPDRPSIERPSFGYTFRWTKPGLANMTVERHPFDTRIKSDEIEVGYYQDEKIISSALGAVIANVTSSQ